MTGYSGIAGMNNRFKIIVSPYPLFVRKGALLLTLRGHTEYMPGMYSLPAGHEESGERMLTCMRREAEEETGLTFREKDAELVHVMHRQEEDVRMDLFFLIRSWRGEPRIREPDKCEAIGWFPFHELPQNTIPYIREAIRAWQSRKFYQERGWSE